jgi:imidazolonepropionase-like amidohydrolase
MAPSCEFPGPTVILAGQLIDGTGAEPRRNVGLIVEDGIITHIDEANRMPPGFTVLDLGKDTVLPGLINMHAHATLPGDGTPFAEWMELPDEILLLKAYANALVSLRAGVTTIRDCGGRGQIMFRVRDAIRTGVVPGPRLILCGRALTITGGHCHYFGGEADGPDQMRRAARQLLKEGADFVKIMASGGGTIGTYPQYPAFETDELRAAIDEAHKIGKRVSCHCLATESIERALDAGTDHIEHCMFVDPDTSVRYAEVVGHRVADAGVYVTATLQVMADLPSGLLERHTRGEASEAEVQYIAEVARTIDTQVTTIGYLHEIGVPIVAGSDAGWRDTGFDDFYEELQYLTRAGLLPLEAIHAATGRAAEACQLAGVIGTLTEGCVADLIAVSDDPLDDFSNLKNPIIVLQSGRVVVDRR